MLFTVPVTFALALTAGPAVMPMQHAAVAPRYEAPIMKKCAGGGVESNRKKYRLKMRQMIWKADTAEKFNTDILSADTERILLKQNWRVRHSMAKKIRAKAAQLEVEIPEAFGSFNVKPVNTPPQKLVPSIAA